MTTPQRVQTQDPISTFLTAYAEYLAGDRLYEDLPPPFAACPATPHCKMTICAQCHPGTASLYAQSRTVAVYFRLRGNV